MKRFTTQPLHTIIEELQKNLFSFEVINPDYCDGIYNGERVFIDGEEYIYRGYKTWLDLAHILECKMLTPIQKSNSIVEIRYKPLKEESFHSIDAGSEEKYGSESIFSKIHKNEEAGFLHYYKQALQNVTLDERKNILNLGVNSGDEFETLLQLTRDSKKHNLIGIDYCNSAISRAKQRFADCSNVSFFTHDINALKQLNLPLANLIISIGTLQSSNLNFQKTLMHIVQNHLSRDGAIILGFPNCRWRDGEMLYGARVKNYPFSEMGLLYKDVMFAKKYLQQKKFRVTVTGKDYIFVTATSIRSGL